MTIHPSVLVVDDEKNEREGIRKFLVPKGYDILLAENAEQAVKIIREQGPDIVLTDLVLPEKDGMWVLEKTKELSPESVVIMFTSYGTVENAVRAIKRGAFHYLTKPIDLDELDATLERAVKGRQLERENLELRKELNEKNDHGDLIAESKAMKEVLRILKQVAPTSSSVLIEGESGTGKEVAAHLIHNWSSRKDKPFVTVHCAALTESLLSSELFGHEKGAFTGATERKIGRFERAHGGTLFLDEVGEIKEELQVKLLRVLQNGEYERVGGTKLLKADVRLICATNKNLQAEVGKQHFREDLYYRINVIRIEMPPLRERKEDIPYLVRRFVSYFARSNNKPASRVDDEAMKLLTQYSWPGNVRELKNVVERMVVLSSDQTLTASSVPSDIRVQRVLLPLSSTPQTAFDENRPYHIRDMEKDLIQKKLNELQGNKSKAAKELGISRRTLYRKIEEYKIITVQ